MIAGRIVVLILIGWRVIPVFRTPREKAFLVLFPPLFVVFVIFLFPVLFILCLALKVIDGIIYVFNK